MDDSIVLSSIREKVRAEGRGNGKVNRVGSGHPGGQGITIQERRAKSLWDE